MAYKTWQAGGGGVGPGTLSILNLYPLALGY